LKCNDGRSVYLGDKPGTKYLVEAYRKIGLNNIVRNTRYLQEELTILLNTIKRYHELEKTLQKFHEIERKASEIQEEYIKSRRHRGK